MSERAANAARGAAGARGGKAMTDRLERFPLVWCGTCEKIQPMLFDEMPANSPAADIVCGECKSIIATLHAARQH